MGWASHLAQGSPIIRALAVDREDAPGAQRLDLVRRDHRVSRNQDQALKLRLGDRLIALMLRAARIAVLLLKLLEAPHGS